MDGFEQMLIVVCIVVFLVFLRAIFTHKTGIKKSKSKANFWGYQLIYTDQKGIQDDDVIQSQMLYSEDYGLRGKPDAIYQKRFSNALVPVELKSGQIGELDSPHTGDLMQLVAYFIMIEECFGVRPKHGKLIYSDYMFKIRNTKRLRKELLAILKDMRLMLKTGSEEVQPDFAKCRFCICRGTVCEFMD